MTNEPGRENEPKTAPTAEKGPAESNAARTWRMLGNNTKQGAGSSRQIVDGGLLGICIAFLIVRLNIQPKGIDTYVNTALFAFVIAMPLLAEEFLCSFYKKPRIVPHAGPSNYFSAMLVGVWVAEGIGWLAAYIGICFVIWHISFLLLIAFVSASVFVVLILPFLSGVGLIVYAMQLVKKQVGERQADAVLAKEPTEQAGNSSESHPIDLKNQRKHDFHS